MPAKGDVAVVQLAFVVVVVVVVVEFRPLLLLSYHQARLGSTLSLCATDTRIARKMARRMHQAARKISVTFHGDSTIIIHICVCLHRSHTEIRVCDFSPPSPSGEGGGADANERESEIF